MIIIDVFAGAADMYNCTKVMTTAGIALGTTAVVCIAYRVKRKRVRRALDRRIPPRRLRMDGVRYVH